MSNMFKMARQAVEMRSKMKKVQKELEAQLAEYENAGVKVVVRGDMTLAKIHISPEAAEPDKTARLERTIVENTNKALKIVKEKTARQMSAMTKDMGLDNILGKLS